MVLQEVDSSSNEIDVIGGEIGALKNLRVVRLSFNRIGSLPAQFSALLQLEELYLDRSLSIKIRSTVALEESTALQLVKK